MEIMTFQRAKRRLSGGKKKSEQKLNQHIIIII